MSEAADKFADKDKGWRRFALGFVGVWAGLLAAVYVFILLVDPYDFVPFSLPLERRIISIDQRQMYPQVVRSRQFDSLITGTSTARLLDPLRLGRHFNARFANLALDSGTAWEQRTMLDYFRRHAGQPKVVIMTLDTVWCDSQADANRVTFRGFPDWQYDDNPWNNYLYLLNTGALELSLRLVGYQLGVYRERSRYDGYQVFVPPESEYDLVKARGYIWGAGGPRPMLDLPPPALPDPEKRALAFPALAWMDQALAALPASTQKILAFMPVHFAAQPDPGSRAAAVEAECKARIAAIARARGATLIDMRIRSDITTVDSNYWDPLHYRVPIATRIADQIAAAVLGRRDSADGTYRLLAP